MATQWSSKYTTTLQGEHEMNCWQLMSKWEWAKKWKIKKGIKEKKIKQSQVLRGNNCREKIWLRVKSNK